MTVRRGPKVPRLTLHVTPVTVRDSGFGSGNVSALVLVVDPGGKARVSAERVAATLGLTLTEARVAVALAKGATALDIAADTGRKHSTIRELVKRIHVKLGISRRADLVRIVLSVGAGPGGRG